MKAKLIGVTIVAMAAVVSTTYSAQASPKSAATSSSSPVGTINVGVPLNVITFNPHASVQGPMMTYLTPIYDTLIRQLPNRTLVPSVATKWEYLDAKRQTFKLTLRTDVKFDDGTPVDAAAVKANILDGEAAKGAFSANLSNVQSIDTSGNTVTIHLSDATPDLDLTLAGVEGMLVEPSALGTKGLASKPAGSGAYTLDPSSVPGTRYVYKARPGYWNPAAFGPATLNLVVLGDQNARLNALRSGQIDATVVFSAQVKTARSAGITILKQPLNINALGLQDRAGVKIPELASKQVRQALNYAIDRPALAKALAFGYGQATDQMFAKSSPAWSAEANRMYPYDLAKAKELLAAAGYAKGFTIPVFSEVQYGTFLEALDGQLQKVGVKLNITLATSGLIPSWSSGQYGSTMVQFGDGNPISLIKTWVLPTSANNPFKTELPGIADMIHAVNIAPTTRARAKALQAISLAVTQEAWFLPAYVLDNFYGVNTKKVTGIQVQIGNSVPYVYGWKVAQQ